MQDWDWIEQEIGEIRFIIEHMSASLNIAYGITLLLDITQEKVLFAEMVKHSRVSLYLVIMLVGFCVTLL